MSTLKVNQIEPRVGGDVTIGESGGTVTLADGATAVGFGPEVPEYPVGQVRAWVNFNGEGTVAIRESLNVSSITDKGVGNYKVNFEMAMEDANYSAVSGVDDCKGTANTQHGAQMVKNFSTTSVDILTGITSLNTLHDNPIVCVAVFR